MEANRRVKAMDDYFARTGIVVPLSTYKPDYLGRSEDQLRRGQLHVEAGLEPSSPLEKEKAEIEEQETMYR